MEMGYLSSFDPLSGYLSLNYLVIIFVVFIPFMFWVFPSRYLFMELKMLYYMNNLFFINVEKKNSGGLLIYVIFFFIILQLNIMGMFPYIFAITSQLNMNMFFSLGFFFCFFLLGWFYYSKIMLSHMTPLGSPFIMVPFLVLIEFSSVMLRPVTLFIRLTANITSGHLIVELLLKPSEFINLNLLVMFYLIFLLPLLILEIVVCFVQAFVISSLSSLYLGEVFSH